jgi:hypothetical protein
VLRRLFAALDARVQVAPSWRGADLDRLVDREHAAIVEALARRLTHMGWIPHVEVTYATGIERGSIDVLGLRPDVRAAVVCEVKSDIAAAEAVGRKLDEKGRLAADIVRARAGWTPEDVAVLLVMPEAGRLRRLLHGPAAALALMFPVDASAVVAWLRKPAGHLAGTWFLSDITARNARRVRPARKGLRTPSRPPDVTVSNVATTFLEPQTRVLR